MTRIYKNPTICEKLCKYLKTISTGVQLKHTLVDCFYIRQKVERDRESKNTTQRHIDESRKKHVKTEDYRQIGFLLLQETNTTIREA